MLQASEPERTPSAGIGVVQESPEPRVERRPHEDSQAANRKQSGVDESGRLSQSVRRWFAVDHWLPRLKSQWSYLSNQKSFCRAPAATTIRLILWRMRCVLVWPATVTLRPWNVKMFLSANWRAIEKLIYALGDHYEPELAYLKQVLSPGSTFVDAGACYGVYALAAGKIVGRQGRVLLEELGYQFFVVEADETLTRVESPPVNRNVVAVYQLSKTNA